MLGHGFDRIGVAKAAPALTLLVLSPIVAEFLLGDFSVRQFSFVLFFIPQYGGGALLVRELTRRTGRGWPTMILLALAYALIEEGFTTQSLFNPNYAGQRLLDYGYVPRLGTSLDWALFVLTLHVVWSLGSTIAVAEAVAGRRWNVAWLGARGLMLTGVVYVAGCAFTIVSTHYFFPYVASARQFIWVAILVGAAIASAFALFGRPTAPDRGHVPRPWIVGGVSFLLCSAFHLLWDHGNGHGLPAALALAGMVAIGAVAVVFLWIWSRHRGWTPHHPLAAATGAILTYGWIGLARMTVAGRTALGIPTTVHDVVGQIVLLAGVLVLIGVGARRLDSRPEPSATASGPY